MKGFAIIGLTTTIGAMTGPDVLGPVFVGGVLGAGSGTGLGFDEGAEGDSGMYFKGKSEMMSPFSDTLAFSVNDES